MEIAKYYKKIIKDKKEKKIQMNYLITSEIEKEVNQEI